MEKSYFKEYYSLEREHWWFLARKEILKAIVKEHLPQQLRGSARILNIGVATGATSEMLQEFGMVTSVEYDEDCCSFLKNELQMEVIQASIIDLPMEADSFDLVCCFDVIEHVENDRKAIAEVYRVVNKKGLVFITVPAFMSLWSEHDVVNHHFRRYRMGSLLKTIGSAPFTIVRKSYFNFFLFLPIWGARKVNKFVSIKDKRNSSGSDFDVKLGSKWMNWGLYRLFLLEKHLLSRRVSFPFGVSLMAIAEK